ncbi:MAG: phosphatidate cytidylyltransferase [Chitinophagaceae bacterium]
MALNIQTLKTRALTAIIFVAIMLAGLLYNYWSFFILFSIIHFGCWVEYQKLVGLIDKDYANISAFHKYAVMLGGFGFMMWNVHYKMQPFGLPVSEIGKWIVVIIAVVFPVKEIVFSKKNNAKVVAHSFFGLAYISFSWGLMMNLRNTGMMFKGQTLFIDFGFTTPIILIASIWINDTMAYIVGSLIGKTPLTKISPKKTWEGTVGGAILAIVVVSILYNLFVDKNNTIKVIGIAAIAAIIGTLGDLLESKLKRLANVKDSGSFMPGHGGFLDRFDSLLLATPFVWLFLWFIN